MKLLTLAAVTAAGLLTTTVGQAQNASLPLPFRLETCGSIAGDPETYICTTTALQKPLEEMWSTTNDLLQTLDTLSGQALMMDHLAFMKRISAIQSMHALSDAELLEVLEGNLLVRNSMLKEIDPTPKAQFVGVWMKDNGELGIWKGEDGLRLFGHDLIELDGLTWCYAHALEDNDAQDNTIIFRPTITQGDLIVERIGVALKISHTLQNSSKSTENSSRVHCDLSGVYFPIRLPNKE